jgi:NTP pyrophosphatase (non-canonical NTP hydrolase)
MARLAEYKGKDGKLVHTPENEWSLSDWSNATLGELGEAANIIKKIRRGDFTLDQAREELGRELADVQTYLDILALRCGVDLGEATIKKWNEVSVRVGCDLRLSHEGYFRWRSGPTGSARRMPPGSRRWTTTFQ